MPQDRTQVRADFERAVLQALEREGPEFDRSAVVKAFTDRASQASLYRWLDGVIKSGKAGVHLAKVVKKAADKRAKRAPDPAADAAREVVEVLPPIPRPDNVVNSGGVVGIYDELKTCIAVAKELMDHARTPEGKPKNAKLLLAASEHLRRSTDTMVRLQEAMMQLVQVERFHQAVFDVLREEDPVLVERVLLRMRQINNQFGVG